MGMTKEQQERYLALAHAIQAGVGVELGIDPAGGNPKHLRTGVNMALVQHAATYRILIAKGICTEEEYNEALIAELEAEKKRYEERISQHYGGNTKINLV